MALRLFVRGVVQGVGFRPYVFTLAGKHGVAGWVRNTSAGVEVHVEGAAAAVEAFADALPREAPPRSYIASCERAAAAPEACTSFTILESRADPNAYQLVSPDIALCDDCRHELLDPRDRRFGYPFINCTNCGPRFTIIESLPYDRQRTTMRHFPLCADCRREYEDPGDRRFHAEPNACPVCGPRVELRRRAQGWGAPDVADDQWSDEGVFLGGEPIEAAAALLREGAIVAVKGLGGLHIACDATEEVVVRRLKERKGRPHKPLAVMFANLEELHAHCRVTSAEEALLLSPEHPIVLLPWREGEEAPAAAFGGPAPASGERAVTPEVAVRQRYLGAMLPYTPLHVLLLRAAGRPLVMTSGNLAEEPIVISWEEAERLHDIPDYYLMHNRDIYARYDDSVAMVRREQPRLVRRSRGYAPFPVPLPRRLPHLLACGAELKNTFCLTRDANAFLSPHIGDLENLETVEHYEASIELYERLFKVAPEAVAYDLHPEYLATKYALACSIATKVGVQHHHAHVAACMVEHGVTEPVIGVSMDGLGYGTDGHLWGGEFLVCDLRGFRRVAHLEELPLPGGELAIRRPARTAAGWLTALLGGEAVERAPALVSAMSAEERAAVAAQVAQGLNAPLTTSCGRLFDAVAALVGLRAEITYEGQAAIELEMVSSPGAEPYPYGLEERPAVSTDGWGSAADPGMTLVLRLAPLLAAALDGVQGGREAAEAGSRLHATVAAMVLDICSRVRTRDGLATVALSGGVFQNRLLTDLCEGALEQDGFRVLTHALVPANDGGLSLGQAAIAGYTLSST